MHEYPVMRYSCNKKPGFDHKDVSFFTFDFNFGHCSDTNGMSPDRITPGTFISMKMLMNKFTFLFAFLFSLTVSCLGQSIVFSGRIENVRADSGQQKLVTLSPPYYLEEKPVEIGLNETGFFRDTLKTGNGVYTLFDGQNVLELYFEKGKNYTIRYNAEKFREGTVVLEGSDTLVNRYFVEKAQNRVFIDRYNTKRSEEDFRTYLGGIRAEHLNRIKRFSLPYKLRSDEERDAEWDYLWELYFFTYVKSEADARYVPSEVTRKELDINYEDEEEYKRNGKYASLVGNYFPVEIGRLAGEFRSKDPSFSIEQSYFRLLDLVVKNEYIRNNLIEQNSRSQLRVVKDKEAFYEDFKKYYTGTDEEFKLKMDNDFLKYSRLKRGTPSPEFFNFMNYRGGTSSLRDFRGRFVYIDVWASWCGNCWYEMPYLKQLEEEYKDKNICFLGISMDRSDQDWRETIAKKHMGGIQLKATDPGDAFFREYAISGIPRYILINENGEVIDYNAPRPSERDKLKELFKSMGL